MALAVSLFGACNPGTTNNNTYNGTNAGMSGGGATKDPGDGTGGATGDGGGGQGILCKKTKEQKISDQLFVRDIYEAIYNHNRKLKNVSNDPSGSGAVQPASIAVLTASIMQFYGPASRNLEFTTEKFWTQFIEKVSFIDDDKKLYPSNDANSPIALPEGCAIVQIAYWDEAAGSDEEGTLYINKNLWAKLDQLNKIGLLAHEYFFKLARKANFKNSDMVRFKVGQLLSDAGITPLFNDWSPSPNALIKDSLPKNSHGFKYCQGTSDEDPAARLQLYQYQGSDHRQHLTIPLLRSNSINANPFQTSNFTFQITENMDLAKATDLMLFQTFASGYGKNLSLGMLPVPWTNNWYNDEDLITFRWDQDKYQKFNSLLNELSRKTEVLWTGHFPQSTNPIKIELLNPAYNKTSGSSKVLKTREELIQTIHVKIEAGIKHCAGKAYSLDLVSRAAVAILNKEISDSITEGIYPDNFPKWRSLVSRIVLNYSKENANSCQILSGFTFQTGIPELLYKLLTRSYSEADIKSSLGSDAYNAENNKNTDDIPFGRLKVSHGSSTLHFDLKCQDYTAVFSEITNKNANTSATAIMIPNKKVSITKEINFSKERLADNNIKDSSMTRLKDVYMAHAKTREAQLPAEILKIQKVSEFLKFDGNDNQKLFERFYSNQRQHCEEEIPPFVATCKQFEYFIADLKQESELNLSPCDFSYSDTLAINVDQTCMIVSMKSTSKRYKVYFNKGNSLSEDEPNIDYFNFDFVRQIPE